MSKIVVTISSFAILLLIIALYLSFFTKSSTVNDDQIPDEKIISEQEAIEIAKAYVFNKYQKHFDDYKIIAELEEDIWIVAYIKPSMMGGGGPAVHIKRVNGEVIGCALQK